MPPNMIGVMANTPNADKGDLFVKDEINLLHQLDNYAEADDVIHEAAFILNRPLPPPHRFGPLYRKYYKVKNSDTT